MNFSELRNNGWCETRANDIRQINEELIEIGRELGNPIAHRTSVGLVQKLAPISSVKAYPNSLSSQYSSNCFPLHVDTAHWVIPCRYMILGCLSEGESKRKTILMDFREIDITKSERELLFNAPFKIANGRNSFYGHVLSRKRNYIRYDPGCMSPATAYGKRISDIFSQERTKNKLKSIMWSTGKIIVVDNWRVLHGRGEPVSDGLDRVLYRILVA